MNNGPFLIRFIVTKEDLKQSYRDILNCPIARAYKRNIDTKCVMCGEATLMDITNDAGYSIRIKDDLKAQMRGNNSWWGRLLGGFEVVLTKIPYDSW